MQFALIVVLLAMLAYSAKSCSLHSHGHIPAHSSQESANISLAAQPGHELLKRWYGVKPLPLEGSGQSIMSPYYYPWPATCNSPTVQPIRYCWKDVRSQQNLQVVIDKAVAAWSHAMEGSSLTVMLDPTCHGNEKCLCSDPGVATDALMISDETRDGDDAWNEGSDCVTASTVGYRYIPKGQPDMPFRHYSMSPLKSDELIS